MSQAGKRKLGVKKDYTGLQAMIIFMINYYKKLSNILEFNHFCYEMSKTRK